MRSALAVLLALAACTTAAPSSVPRDASVDALPDAPVEASVPERARTPSTRALADLAGFSLPYRDMPTASDAASRARRAWALRTVRALGLHRIRREVFWTDVEPREGEFHFEAYDPIVQGCADAQIELLAVLAYGNPWATRAMNADQYFPPDDPQTFARFAAAVARRYRDRVHDWEVWNEPNAGFRFWRPELRGDPVAFGALVDAARSALTAEDPMARVAYGGTVFLPQVLTGGVEFARASFTARPSLAAGLGAFAMHAYTLYPPRASPESDAMGEVAHVRKVAQTTAMLDDVGFDRTRPLWITEIGWPTTQAVGEVRQAAWLVRAVLLSALAGVDGVWIYQLGDGPSASELVPEDRFGIFRHDANTADATDPEPKPAATALRELFTRWGRFRVTARETLAGAPDDVHALTLDDGNGHRATALWRALDDAPAWRWNVPSDATVTALDGASVVPQSGTVAVASMPVFVTRP